MPDWIAVVAGAPRNDDAREQHSDPHPDTCGPGATEAGATLALAWPLILANLTMALIQATDVLLMGRLGARPLAASALGLNLNFAFSLICLGLVTASSPMIATALGRRFNNVREVRRTFRQSLWLIATVTPPIWLILWNAEPIIAALGQDRGAGARRRAFSSTATCGRCCRSCCSRRCAISSPRSSGRAGCWASA